MLRLKQIYHEGRTSPGRSNPEAPGEQEGQLHYD